MKPGKYGPFAFSTIERRPRLQWPNGAHVALWVIPNYEFFALDERIPSFGRADPPDIIPWASRDYGNRVGAGRVQRLLDRYKIRATVALNSNLCAQHPELIADGVARNWEWMGHGQSNTRPMRSIPPERERSEIHDALAEITAATGTRPAGWLGPGLQESWHTLDYLADEGIRYIADWCNDDQPYVMQLEGGKRVVAMPYSTEINDKAYESGNISSAEFSGMIRRQFDVLYREGAESGRVIAIAYHPYLSGVPHRIDDLDRALEHICRHEHVWLATGNEIAQHYLATAALAQAQ